MLWNAGGNGISALGSPFTTGETIDPEEPSRCYIGLAWEREVGGEVKPLLLHF